VVSAAHVIVRLRDSHPENPANLTIFSWRSSQSLVNTAEENPTLNGLSATLKLNLLPGLNFTTSGLSVTRVQTSAGRSVGFESV
jgi:hypothetical protein